MQLSFNNLSVTISSLNLLRILFVFQYHTCSLIVDETNRSRGQVFIDREATIHQYWFELMCIGKMFSHSIYSLLEERRICFVFLIAKLHQKLTSLHI